jgi:FMN-dependent oxidoreductase (nitrilotriacetate monooxygenase family)
MTKHMHLNLFMHGRGHHEASWRHPKASPLPLTDIRYYTDVARKAEAGLFDSIFLADSLGVGEDVANAPRTWLEPITTLAALAGATSRIGLIATCSTTYTEPFNLARQFASIDHLSNGRVGWNIVTTWLASASGNYGGQGPLSHAERYERAEEYMRVVNGLWDSWSDDAVLDDRASGRYARADGLRALNHAGRYYQVTAPLNLPRGPQGRPVFVQAGSSETGRRFAARHAEAVFTAQMEKATARDFYIDLKRLGVGIRCETNRAAATMAPPRQRTRERCVAPLARRRYGPTPPRSDRRWLRGTASPRSSSACAPIRPTTLPDRR